MAGEMNTAQAKKVFATVCQVLDHQKWSYKKNEEKLSIDCSVRGDDLPMELTIKVDAERSLVMLLSHLPFVVKEDKRLDMAVAASAVNNLLVDGSFDYSVTSGHMFFRMTNSFIESDLGGELFAYMIYCACRTIDDYNDKFLMLAKGMLSMEQFLGSVLN